jgi:hypothetical protein
MQQRGAAEQTRQIRALFLVGASAHCTGHIVSDIIIQMDRILTPIGLKCI